MSFWGTLSLLADVTVMIPKICLLGAEALEQLAEAPCRLLAGNDGISTNWPVEFEVMGKQRDDDDNDDDDDEDEDDEDDDDDDDDGGGGGGGGGGG